MRDEIGIARAILANIIYVDINGNICFKIPGNPDMQGVDAHVIINVLKTMNAETTFVGFEGFDVRGHPIYDLGGNDGNR